MNDHSSNDVWILGATGRVGRALARALARRSDVDLVLVGRVQTRLDEVAARHEGTVRTLTFGDFDELIERVAQERPRAVVNLMGSYSTTSSRLASACMPGGAYVDLANDLDTLQTLLDLHDEAVTNSMTLITGGGFGVLGTEAVVAALCADRPVPSSIRVDALASFASEEGITGQAFAQTSVDVITAGGLSYRDGNLTPIRLGSNFTTTTLPDGTSVDSASVPSGELIAAQRLSGAPNVDFTSGLAPTAPLIRVMLPLMHRLAQLGPVRRALIKLMASAKTKSAPRPRPHSWGHASVTWPDGSVREGWLKADDAMEFTSASLRAIVEAVIEGSAPHGAFTPAAALGSDIAVSAGAELLLG